MTERRTSSLPVVPASSVGGAASVRSTRPRSVPNHLTVMHTSTGPTP